MSCKTISAPPNPESGGHAQEDSAANACSRSTAVARPTSREHTTRDERPRAETTYPAEHVVQSLQRALLHDPRVRLIGCIRDRVVRQVLCAVVSRSLDSSQSSRAYTHVHWDGRVDEQPREHPAQLPARKSRDLGRRERLQKEWARRNDAREHRERVLLRGRCRASRTPVRLPRPAILSTHSAGVSAVSRGSPSPSWRRTIEWPMRNSGRPACSFPRCRTHHSTSASCSRQLVRPYKLCALFRALSSAVRPNPRWSYAKTVMPRAAYCPCAHSYRPMCSAKPCTKRTIARGGLEAAGYVLV